MKHFKIKTDADIYRVRLPEQVWKQLEQLLKTRGYEYPHSRELEADDLFDSKEYIFMSGAPASVVATILKGKYNG